MPQELPIRYYNTPNKPSKFAEGDIIFAFNENSVNKIFRLIVDTCYGDDLYLTYRLDDSGNRVGSPYMIRKEQVSRFHKDKLLTNLIGGFAERTENV